MQKGGNRMKKWLLFTFAFFLTGLTFICGTKFEAAEQATIVVHLTEEGKNKHPGLENISLDIYDLTAWKDLNGVVGKDAQELILNSYKTKEKLNTFIQNEQLPKLNQAAISFDQSDKAEIKVDRYRNQSSAAYLIVGNGETGRNQLLPFVVFLPMYDSENVEVDSIDLYGKYITIPTPDPDPMPDPDPDPDPDPSPDPDPTPDPDHDPKPSPEPDDPNQTPSDKVTTEKGPGQVEVVNRIVTDERNEYGINETAKPAIGKSFPQTNDELRNYLLFGAGLVLIAYLGLINEKIRRKTNE